MNLKTWLKAKPGRATALAKRLGVTCGRITQIADDGVPLKHMSKIISVTDGAVTLEEMVFNRQTPRTARHTETA